MLRRYVSVVIVLSQLMLLSGSGHVIGQSDNMCPALVEKALEDMSANCGGLGRNAVCYGYNRIDATFFRSEVADLFRAPADRAELVALQSIQTAPLDTAQGLWGIAVMYVQANVPNTMPGQGVVFLLMGDVQVENAVPPEEAFIGQDAVTVTTHAAANFRSLPTTNANVVGSTPEGAPLQVDGLSPDGAWLRIMTETGPAWVSRDLVSAEADLSTLPTISQENRSPMQAFYFSTGVGRPACNEEVPSTLVVQGPQGISVDITANGANVRIGSTIALRTLESGQMQLMVISGSVQLGDLVIPAGFTIFLPLSDDGQSPAGGWEGFRPMTQDELDSLQGLEHIEPNLLNYPIIIPTTADIQEMLAILSQAAGGGQGSDQGTGNPQCAGFRQTSPLGIAPYGPVDFYWDPIPGGGAVTYRLVISDADGSRILERDTTGTSVNVDTAGLAAARADAAFLWSVDAYVNGEVLCSTGNVVVTRPSDPNAPPLPPPTPKPGPVCGNGILEPGEQCNGPNECFADNGGC